MQFRSTFKNNEIYINSHHYIEMVRENPNYCMHPFPHPQLLDFLLASPLQVFARCAVWRTQP